MTVVPNALAIDLTFEACNHVFVNKTLSAIEPPPICFDFYKAAKACLQLDQIHFSDDHKHLDACLEFEVKLLKIQLLKVRLGCFSV